MIPMSSHKYYLKHVTRDAFWAAIESKTVGQYINPEFGYTTPFLGNFNNEFGGRRTNNFFSIYLYRPITRGFREEVPAKGELQIHNNQLVIKTNYEIPFWSFMMFIVIAGLLSIQFIISLPVIGSLIFIALMILIYGAITISNYLDLKRVFERVLIDMKAATN